MSRNQVMNNLNRSWKYQGNDLISESVKKTDLPKISSHSLLFRVARAGRFGTKGLAITFVSDEADAKTLNEVQDRLV